MTSPPERRVEVAGGLVGEEHERSLDDRAGDRDPLTLAAGELRRTVRDPICRGPRGQRIVAASRRRRAGAPV